MSVDNENLSKKLGISPSIVTNSPPVKVETKLPEIVSKAEVVSKELDQEDLDYKNAKSKVEEALEIGSEALTEILTLAKESQQPRAFEVLSNLVKTQAEVASTLIKISMDKAQFDSMEAEEAKKNEPKNQTINNNLIIGNASDLLKLVKEAEKTVKESAKVIEGYVED